MSEQASNRPRENKGRIVRLRHQILAVDLLCPGSLVTRFNTCGKAHCRCAEDPAARHGPYYIWSRREEGRLVQTVVSASQAKALDRAIRNHRKVLELLVRWGRESARLILARKDVN
jgi:hypothetical protein